jgi:hypothetical protein
MQNDEKNGKLQAGTRRKKKNYLSSNMVLEEKNQPKMFMLFSKPKPRRPLETINTWLWSLLTSTSGDSADLCCPCKELYRGSNIHGYHWRHKVRKIYIGNGVVQRAVLSVTLFLIAISEMTNKTKEPCNERPKPRRNQTIRNASTNGRNTGICG